EQLRRARVHARLGGATPAYVGVHGDVRLLGHAELDRGHPVLEAGARVPSLHGHPNVLHPVHPSLARSRSRTPVRLRSACTQRRMPALGCGSVTVKTRWAIPQTSSGYAIWARSPRMSLCAPRSLRWFARTNESSIRCR